MKAVLDSSVLVSAFLRPGGPPGRVVAAARAGRYVPVLSPLILDETRRSLLKPRNVRLYNVSLERVSRFADALVNATRMLDAVPPIPPVCRDPDDDHVLAAALAAEADYLVTGDGDLLVLGRYGGTRVVVAAEFLRLLT